MRFCQLGLGAWFSVLTYWCSLSYFAHSAFSNALISSVYPKLRRFSDEEAVEELNMLHTPEGRVKLLKKTESVYEDKLAAAILEVVMDAKQPLTKLTIARKLPSDYPIASVSRALTKLARSGELRSRSRWEKGARSTEYYLTTT